MPGNVDPVSTSSYRWYESLVPFYDPDEVDNCKALLDGRKSNSSFSQDKWQKTQGSCDAVVERHRKVKILQKALFLLAGLGIFWWLKGKRDGGDPPGGGGVGRTEGDAPSQRPSAPEPVASPRRGKAARRQAADAIPRDGDKVWADTTKAGLGGSMGIGAIPHMSIQPGTRWILSALERAKREHVARFPGDPFHLMEVGTGTGLLADIMSKRLGARVHATDVKPVQIYNDGSAPLIHFEQASAVNLPAQAGSVPAWVSSFTWEYAGPKALDEAHRVLADGGTAVAISHYGGSATSRMLVAMGRLATRALELEKMLRGSDRKSKAYQKLLTDIEAETEWGKSWVERAINRGAYRNYARMAYFGTLTPFYRMGLTVQATAGRELEWIIGKSTDELRTLFESKGFDVVEMKPVRFRLLGIFPSTSHEGLGIVARKRPGGISQEGPAGGAGPAASGSSGASSPTAGGGAKGKKSGPSSARFSGLVDFSGDAEPAMSPVAAAVGGWTPGWSPQTIVSSGALFGGLPALAFPAAMPAPAFAR